jgi:hypothetical protein
MSIDIKSCMVISSTITFVGLSLLDTSIRIEWVYVSEHLYLYFVLKKL